MTKADEEGQRKAPILRFKGFTDDWEQRKLNSIFETVSKKGFSNLPVLTATQTKGMIYRNNSGIDIKFNENTLNNYKLVEPNQFVVHLRSFQGGLAASSLRGIASPAYTVLRFKDNKQEVSFWKEFFRSKKFINSLVKVTYGIRDGRTIKVSDLLDLKYRIPGQNLEQCKVGHLINFINKLLTLYDRKLKLLSQIKKYFLDNLFAKKEYPNLRFKGFTDAWEQRQLGKVIERRTQKREFSDLPYIEYADIIPNIGRLNKDIFSRKNTKQGIYFQKNDILFGKLRPYLNNWLKPQFEGIAVGDFWILNGIKLNNDFLYYYIQTKKFSDVANVTTGTKMPRSDWNLVSNLKINFPNFEEQQNIGKLFYSLENLITLYENKQKHLTEIKNTLLNTMFI